MDETPIPIPEPVTLTGEQVITISTAVRDGIIITAALYQTDAELARMLSSVLQDLAAVMALATGQATQEEIDNPELLEARIKAERPDLAEALGL